MQKSSRAFELGQKYRQPLSQSDGRGYTREVDFAAGVSWHGVTTRQYVHCKQRIQPKTHDLASRQWRRLSFSPFRGPKNGDHRRSPIALTVGRPVGCRFCSQWEDARSSLHLSNPRNDPRLQQAGWPLQGPLVCSAPCHAVEVRARQYRGGVRMACSLTASRAMSDVADDEPRFLDCFKTFFDRASALSHHPHDVLETLRSCNSILRVEFPVRVRVPSTAWPLPPLSLPLFLSRPLVQSRPPVLPLCFLSRCSRVWVGTRFGMPSWRPPTWFSHTSPALTIAIAPVYFFLRRTHALSLSLSCLPCLLLASGFLLHYPLFDICSPLSLSLPATNPSSAD